MNHLFSLLCPILLVENYFKKHSCGSINWPCCVNSCGLVSLASHLSITSEKEEDVTELVIFSIPSLFDKTFINPSPEYLGLLFITSERERMLQELKDCIRINHLGKKCLLQIFWTDLHQNVMMGMTLRCFAHLHNVFP